MAEREFGPDEHRYRMLVEAITDYAIYMLDLNGRVTSWNPGAQRFKGYTAGEIIGQHFSRFYTPEDQARGVPAKALASASTQGRFEAEGWRVRKDGTRFWAHVVIDPIRDPEGQLVGFAKITRDLTERMETQEALRASQEQLRLLVQGVTDYAIYMLDRGGNVVNWNAGAERIKGYRPDEIIGQHFSRFYTPEDQQAQAPARALATAESEGRFEKEGWRVRKDGSRFWAHVVVDPIRNDDGELIGFAKVTRDITERLKSDQALAEAQQALFQAQKIEAIGQLTGGVAHDFNNLLAAILGSLELVRKRLPYDPRITPLLENAIQGAERGAALTERMLAFARKQELQYEAVDVPVLVRGMLDFIERTIGGGIQVSLQFPTNMPRVLTDPFQLEAAILNLAVNARDAMAGGGKITIGAEARLVAASTAELAAGEYVVLRVADTGEGMTPETLAKATEPFFTTKGVGKGTGLGLSMVHGLAAQSGGKISIESTPGKGTCVEIWLPVTEEAGRDGTPEKDGAQDWANPQGRLILVVDDDNLVLVNTAAMLEDLGHQVTAASSGAEAIAILGEHPGFDLLITDEVMPGMTGSQLADVALDLRPGLPVLLATGFADMGHTDAVLKMDLPRLAKPFSQAQLAEAVDAMLTRPA
jgi:PAS domain S-box-containing protein